MISDPIVDEVRKSREEYAAQFNFDLSALMQDLQEQQRGDPMLVSMRPTAPLNHSESNSIRPEVSNDVTSPAQW
jgi:hypothetical protein